VLGDRSQHLETAGDDLERIVVEPLEREPRPAAVDGSFPQCNQERAPMRSELALLDVARHHQRVVHLVRCVRHRPGFLPYALDRRGIERAEVVGTP